MLSKCIGIISYFPDKEPLRTHRKESFRLLVQQLEKYFKLPIIIIAQNWREEDYNDVKYSYLVTIYSYKQQLGVTGARIKLQEQLLKNHNEFDYYIFLDDDSKLIITEEGVKNYFNEMEAHPDMVGTFHSIWWRLLAISNYMLHRTNYYYIKNYESIRGEIWEDLCWKLVWAQIYPDRFFKFSMKGLTDIFTNSSDDPDSTWFKPEFNNLYTVSKKIADRWYANEKGKNND